MQFSVIIPTYNEAETLLHAIKHLLSGMDPLSEVEIIVCDGGSADTYLQQVEQYPVTILTTKKGRAIQMNTGSLLAVGEWLVFLHADTQLPKNWMSLIQQCDRRWGHFDVHLSGGHWSFRIIEKFMNIRSRKTSVATGDQVLFFQRDFFQQIGGFPEIPLMEDIAISKLARKQAVPACISQPVTTSSRRWEKNGILRTILLMWFLRLAYWLGMKPATLHRLYYS